MLRYSSTTRPSSLSPCVLFVQNDPQNPPHIVRIALWLLCPVTGVQISSKQLLNAALNSWKIDCKLGRTQEDLPVSSSANNGPIMIAVRSATRPRDIRRLNRHEITECVDLVAHRHPFLCQIFSVVAHFFLPSPGSAPNDVDTVHLRCMYVCTSVALSGSENIKRIWRLLHGILICTPPPPLRECYAVTISV